MIKLGVVGGTFDNDGGRPSFVVTELSKQLNDIDVDVLGRNGGYISQLKDLSFLKHYDALLWMPNIDNNVEKILPRIKKEFPHVLLIQTKRVIENEYEDFALVKRLLDSHSTMGVKITKIAGDYVFSVIDPLGNCWGEHLSIKDLATTLIDRITLILSMQRIGSTQVGERTDFEIEHEFLQIVAELGTEFTKYVTAINPNRFLGNASTRCCHGFPSARVGESIFISKRNVDKTIITSDQFVEVKSQCHSVSYFGDNKPSVDTPVQLALYTYYANVNYIIHGHVYIRNAPFTHKFVPCGYIEETGEITSLYPDPTTSNFVVNLKGHGCIILAESLDFFDGIQFQSRPMLEHHITQ